MENVLTVSEVADRLRVCDETVYRMVSNKEIKAFKVRGAIRITEKEVERIIQEGNEAR